MPDNTSRHVIITGRVQGVSFRHWTKETALSLGLSGWVRNRKDGTVEAFFEGPENTVHHMIEKCQSGPTLAHVQKVKTLPQSDANRQEIPETRDRFSILSSI